MNQVQLQKIIGEFYVKLPSDTQKAFGSMEWLETLKEISKSYNLNEQQISTLGTETTLVLLGVIHLDEYEALLLKELTLSQESTKKIMQEIDEKIFKELRPVLKKAYEKNVTDINLIDVQTDPRLENVTENLREAIATANYKEKLFVINSKYKTTEQQQPQIDDSTLRFIAGVLSLTQYESALILSTNWDVKTAKQFAQEVNEKIVNKIQVLAEEIAKEQSEDDDLPPPPPPYLQEKVKNTVNETIISGSKEKEVQEGPLSHSEKNVFASAGIEMVEDSRSAGIMADKLKSVTVSKQVMTDFTLPKMTNRDNINTQGPKVDSLSKKSDPYHEEI